MRNRTAGKIFIIAPPVTLIVSIVVWFTTAFMGIGKTEGIEVLKGINFFFAFLGYMSVIMIPIGIVIGILLMMSDPKVKKEPAL